MNLKQMIVFGLGCIELLHQSCIFSISIPYGHNSMCASFECIDGIVIHIGRPLAEANALKNENFGTHDRSHHRSIGS